MWTTGHSHRTFSAAIPIKPFLISDVLMVPRDAGLRQGRSLSPRLLGTHKVFPQSVEWWCWIPGDGLKGLFQINSPVVL